MRTLIRRLFKVALVLGMMQALLLGAAVAARRFIREWGDEESDEFQLAAVLDGREMKSRARNLRGATVIACYGGVELDLRGAQLSAGGADLRVVAIFGGVSLLVPDGWNVHMKTTAVLGGSEKRTTADEDLPPGAPQLTIRATAAFGGVAVRAKAPSLIAA
ncbi:MAG TPA: LiaF domain-containing protein [Acidimicrobiia bacterium]